MVRVEEAYDDDMDLLRLYDVAMTAMNPLFHKGMAEWDTFERPDYPGQVPERAQAILGIKERSPHQLLSGMVISVLFAAQSAVD